MMKETGNAFYGLRGDEMPTYYKLVYASEPIGEEKIILKLYTFDLEGCVNGCEAKEYDLGNLKRVPSTYHKEYFDSIEQTIRNEIARHYEEEIEKLKRGIRAMGKITYNAGDVFNVDQIECDTIRGDVVNCNCVKVKNIKGDIVNCRVEKM